jgi:hypothetical protein
VLLVNINENIIQHSCQVSIWKMGVKHLLNCTDLVRKMSGNKIIGPHKGFVFFFILKWKANGDLDVEEKDNLNSV